MSPEGHEHVESVLTIHSGNLQISCQNTKTSLSRSERIGVRSGMMIMMINVQINKC